MRLELAERCLSMLRALQWEGHIGQGCETCDDGAKGCPMCLREKRGGFPDRSGHAEGCELAALIAEVDAALEVPE